jgi:hypothetical protein
MAKQKSDKQKKPSYLAKERGHVRLLQKVLKGEKEEVKQAKKK